MPRPRRSAGGRWPATARVPWAIHAVAHVMEMQGRHAEGAVWMAIWRPFWGVGNGFAAHLGWHEALFALEARDHAKALELFDLYLDAEANEITLQRVDAASLLWRLALHGADVGDRWQRLLAGWALSDPSATGGSAFNDLHALLALLGAGERGAGALDERVAGRADRSGPWNREVSRSVATPLMQGLVAFAEGRFADAARLLQPLRGAAGARLGGSHAQRDVIDQTLLAAAARGGARRSRPRLLAERARARANTPLGGTGGQRSAGRARRADGDQTGRRLQPFGRERALHRRALQHPRQVRLQMRQVARRSAEAAGPAAEHEGIGIADAEGRRRAATDRRGARTRRRAGRASCRPWSRRAP